MNQKKFHAGLKYLLAKAGRGVQKKIAEYAGVKPSYVSNIIRGLKPAYGQAKASFADFFTLKVEDVTFLGEGILAGYSGALFEKALVVRNDPHFNFISKANDWYTTETANSEHDTNLFFALALSFFYIRKGERLLKQISLCIKSDTESLKSALCGNIHLFSNEFDKNKISNLFIFNLNDLLELGQRIIAGISAEEYLLDYCNDFFIYPECYSAEQSLLFTEIKKTIRKNNNFKLLFEWINQQDNSDDYWVLLKLLLSREEPEFKKWLKQPSK